MILRASRFLPGLAVLSALFAACAQGELKGGSGGGSECDRRIECPAGEACQDGECVPEGNQGQGGGNPYGYDACCAASNAPGCGAPNIESCVCAFDDYCCTSAWDVECVTRAIACGACDAAAGVATGSGVGPATTSSGAASGAGGGSSSTSATSAASTSSASSGGGGGDCCMPNGSPGCNDVAIESCVCGADLFCCDTAWDAACVDGAMACGGCGGSSAASSSSSSGGGSSACCLTSSLPGCSDAPVEACVCTLDPYCCDTAWDSTCVSEAENDCSAVCF
ncbi:MAG: hypothetical protein WKG00_09625 [Polyangiaceae bacterium]